jgi:hypothetical protein
MLKLQLESNYSFNEHRTVGWDVLCPGSLLPTSRVIKGRILMLSLRPFLVKWIALDDLLELFMSVESGKY